MEAISISQLRKRFRKLVALRDVDLTVNKGEIVALLGPNGAGKSTLLRILATTILADGGTAAVAGHDVVAEAAAVRRSIGVITGDQRAWYWRLTGRENLEFYACLNGLRRGPAAARARELLEEVGLSEDGGRRVGEYSSGMRARLALARSLLIRPPVLLLDEPTQNLDPAAAVAFRLTVAELASARQAAILFATHNLYEAAELADRIVGLVAGRIAFARSRGASPAELEHELLDAAPLVAAGV